MIFNRIKRGAPPGTPIPKPIARYRSRVSRYATKRGRPALTYTIRNRRDPAHPYEKGVTDREFQAAYDRLRKAGQLTRRWFNNALHRCATEGPCNFTTIGGVFEILGLATYAGRGVYRNRRPTP